MRKLTFTLTLLLAILTVKPVTFAQSDTAQPALATTSSETKDTVEWLQGPFLANVGDMGTIPVPGSYLFADANNTRKILRAMELTVTGSEIAMIRPANAKQDWYVVFDFADDGFVEDDEADSLDSSGMLSILQDINEEENQQRINQGWAPTKILGWDHPPAYNRSNNYLTWALRVERDAVTDINVNTRALGRHGVMIVNLVVSPEQKADVLPVYEAMIDQFDYRDGHRYSEFREGDKIARYGLSALITGTAATAMLKTGLLRRLLTPIIAALLAVTATVKRWFGGNQRITPTSPVPNRKLAEESRSND